jgi:hypothetical protein
MPSNRAIIEEAKANFWRASSRCGSAIRRYERGKCTEEAMQEAVAAMMDAQRDYYGTVLEICAHDLSGSENQSPPVR